MITAARIELASWWDDLRDSLWLIPAVATAIAVALAFLMVRLDRSLIAGGQTGADWLFGAGASGAREVLSAIAGTMITVTGVVFSITIVALQLASSQFTPRVLRTFTGDRGNQIVLGVFIATFTYALLVLRTVREGAGDQAEPFVPAASVSMAIVLAVVSIGFLIYYISHAANSIRASVIIDRAAHDIMGLIDQLFPDEIGRPAPTPSTAPEAPSVPATLVRADGAGYLQAIDADALFDLAEKRAFLVRVEPLIGEFVLPGAPLAAVWPAATLPPPVERAIRAALVLGPERTLQSDVEYGLRQLADIAIKALSPAVNDPTTAIICIDRLAEALTRLAARARPQETRTGKDGRLHLILHGPPFARLVSVAFGQIRHYGAGDAVVAAHLATTLGRMAELVPAERRPPLRREARLVAESARGEIAIPEDLERVERSAVWTEYAEDMAALGGGAARANETGPVAVRLGKGRG
jgi:uncharacterized membrane protein